jgi:hypothetical protein
VALISEAERRERLAAIDHLAASTSHPGVESAGLVSFAT